MRCESCPLQAGSTVSLEQTLTMLNRCNACELDQGNTARLVALLREAGRESRKQRAEVRRLKDELRDFEEGTHTDRGRIEKLETLHAAAMRELESALSERDELVRQQVQAIRALSAPILEVSGGVLAVPIIGTLSEERSRDIMQDLLEAVISRGAEKVALDLTGVNEMDAATADRIGALCKAVMLIGARVVISGLRPDVVSTLVEANVDFSAVKTVRSLKDAIRGHQERRKGRAG